MGPRVTDPDFSHGRPCFPHSERGHLLTAWPELSGAWAHRTQSKRKTDKVHRTRFQSQKVTNSKVSLLLKLENKEKKETFLSKKNRNTYTNYLGYQGAMGRVGFPAGLVIQIWALEPGHLDSSPSSGTYYDLGQSQGGY